MNRAKLTYFDLLLHTKANSNRCDKYGLTWLQMSMSYSRYTNLSRKLNIELARKVMDGMEYMNLESIDCNYTKQATIEDW
mmetsp:Transcript_16485/g.29797  ORF Transcript_16485/g.29797 Transcript_16485/m.29797 type:complete len:80 (+) Transcript_16485:1601-1840(+)